MSFHAHWINTMRKLFLLIVFSLLSTAAHPERPNILWLSAEDMGPDLGCYGDPDAITPSIDALAARGLRFTNVFTVAPVCAPNRSSIITGVYPTTLGSMHMRSGAEGSKTSPQPMLPQEVRCFPEYLRKAGYYCTNNEKEDYNFAPTPPETWDESSGNAHWQNRPDPRQPFFAVFNFTGTHESKVRDDGNRLAQWTEKLTPEQRHAPLKITLPPHHPDTPAVRRQWANYHDLITALDYWVGDHLKQLEESGLAEDTIVFFWSDHGAGLPRHKRWVYDSGTHVPLIIHAPEKWAERLGITQGVNENLVSSIDFAPTALAFAGLSPPGYMQGQVIAGASAAPPREYAFSARDRMDERVDTIRSVRDKRFRYVSNYQPWVPNSQYIDYCERGDIQKELRRLTSSESLPEGCHWFSKQPKPAEELYDCAKDPYALTNLADDPAFEAELLRMRTVNREWMTGTRDLGLLPEPELNRLEKKFGSRYAIHAGRAAEDPTFWAQLHDVASAARTEGDGGMDDLLEAAKSTDAAIRYWAAVGLRRAHITHDLEMTLLALSADPCPEVRIAAAYALLGEKVELAAQVNLLAELLANEDRWVRLYAATALDTIGEAARPVIPALQEAMKDRGNKYVVRVASHALNMLLGTENVVP